MPEALQLILADIASALFGKPYTKNAAGNAGIERDLPPVDPGDGQSQRLAAREGRFDYLPVALTGISEPLPAAEPRPGRRTALTFPLLPPPQKN